MHHPNIARHEMKLPYWQPQHAKAAGLQHALQIGKGVVVRKWE
jgi:hypothetical protein